MKGRKCDKQREDRKMIEWRMNEWMKRWMDGWRDVKRGLKENESKGEMEESECNIIWDWVHYVRLLTYQGAIWRRVSRKTLTIIWRYTFLVDCAWTAYCWKMSKSSNITHFIRTVRTLLFQSDQWRTMQWMMSGEWTSWKWLMKMKRERNRKLDNEWWTGWEENGEMESEQLEDWECQKERMNELCDVSVMDEKNQMRIEWYHVCQFITLCTIGSIPSGAAVTYVSTIINIHKYINHNFVTAATATSTAITIRKENSVQQRSDQFVKDNVSILSSKGECCLMDWWIDEWDGWDGLVFVVGGHHCCHCVWFGSVRWCSLYRFNPSSQSPNPSFYFVIHHSPLLCFGLLSIYFHLLCHRINTVIFQINMWWQEKNRRKGYIRCNTCSSTAHCIAVFNRWIANRFHHGWSINQSINRSINEWINDSSNVNMERKQDGKKERKRVRTRASISSMITIHSW